MNLKENQFLKIKVLHGNWTDFEIFELPEEKWRRPKRYHLQVPQNRIANRHTQESKRRFLIESLALVQFGFLSEFYGDENGIWWKQSTN